MLVEMPNFVPEVPQNSFFFVCVSLYLINFELHQSFILLRQFILFFSVSMIISNVVDFGTCVSNPFTLWNYYSLGWDKTGSANDEFA